MTTCSTGPDLEKRGSVKDNHRTQPQQGHAHRLMADDSPRSHLETSGNYLGSPSSNNPPFAGRLGGNLSFAVDRADEKNASLLLAQPDAAPNIPIGQLINLHQFTSLALWKAAILEGIGTMLLVFFTIWANTSPNELPTKPTARFGYFDNAAYLGPLTGAVSNFALLTLFTFTLGPVTGAHLNPLITMATFFARLCTLPRTILYLSFQLLGSALAGYFVRAAYGSRDFKVGGCWLFDEVVPVQDALAVEFVTATGLVFMAFGVGLDPRQKKVIPPSLSPFLVGLVLGVLSWATGYTRYGYGGASLNPARCFGAMVGSHFHSWHWFQWVGDVSACIFHGIIYCLVPPKSAYV